MGKHYNSHLERIHAKRLNQSPHTWHKISTCAEIKQSRPTAYSL